VVQVYGKEECVQCEYTKKKLDENGIPYEYHDITKDEIARQVVEGSGYSQLPFVVADINDQDKMWHGFSPDKIKALA
jgi:glutaredoxin-like protein NrdH